MVKYLKFVFQLRNKDYLSILSAFQRDVFDSSIYRILNFFEPFVAFLFGLGSNAHEKFAVAKIETYGPSFLADVYEHRKMNDVSDHTNMLVSATESSYATYRSVIFFPIVVQFGNRFGIVGHFVNGFKTGSESVSYRDELYDT